VLVDSPSNLITEAVRAARNATTHALADDEDVGLQIPELGGPARAGGEGVRLVNHEERAVDRGELAQACHESWLWEHDADVRERRLGQDRCDIAMRQGGLDTRKVVELGNPGGQVEGVLAPRRCQGARRPRRVRR
jgi:hypothetical protein